jgi:hypothetical protein
MTFMKNLKEAWQAANDISRSIDRAHDALPLPSNFSEKLDRALDKGMAITLKAGIHAAAPLYGALKYTFERASTSVEAFEAAPPVSLDKPLTPPKQPGP